MVWGCPILHGARRHQGRSTTGRLLRVILGPVDPWGAVEKVAPGCAVLESVGDPYYRGMVSVEVGVSGRWFPRVTLTPGVRWVSRGAPRGVLTSGGGRRTGCL